MNWYKFNYQKKLKQEKLLIYKNYFLCFKDNQIQEENLDI